MQMSAKEIVTKQIFLAVTSAVFAATCTIDTVLAGGTLPGDSSGQAYAVPLPEGVYFWDTPSYGTRPNGKSLGVDENSFANVPVFFWSTPLKPLGGRLELAATIPELFVGFPSNAGYRGPSSLRGLYNSLFAAIWAFDFGNGFNASLLSGVYIPENPGKTGVSVDAWVAREGLNVAYAADGWTAAANLSYQFQGKDYLTGLPSANDNFVYDLTLTKTIDKIEFGPVGFGSADTNQHANSHPAAQFALGGLVGYNFGPVAAQIYATHDVAQRNLGGYETRVWSRIIIPLWSPAPTSVSQGASSKY
jgi:hypothetical protein